MSDFLRGINRFSPLSEEASDEFSHCIQTEIYQKGEMINSERQICRHLFFVESGLVKHYYYHNTSHYVLRFFEEGTFFLVTDSFFNNLPAEYSTVALEDSQISFLAYSDFEHLCLKHHTFESFARKLISQVAFNTISKLKSQLYLDATERYRKFLDNYAHLQQRISLGDTAGYLGISQVSLSRIRARK